MKLFFTILLNFFLFNSSFAGVVGRVLEVKGNAFSFLGKDIKALKYGEKIENLTELMVEDGAALSVANNAGQVFHIRGGSLVKLYNSMVELKNGNMWVIANEKSQTMFSSPNSVGKFSQGQFIYSFDNISGKSQVLVLTGDVEFANALEPTLKANVSSGQFSIVDPKYENGTPRTPTRVGLKSFTETKMQFTEFKAIQDLDIEKMLWNKSTKKETKRSIASVSKSEGKVLYIKTIKGSSRSIASVNEKESAMGYYQSLKKSTPKVKKWQGKTVEIRYFQGSKKSTNNSVQISSKKAPASSNRTPASVGSAAIIKELRKSDFEKSLDSESKVNTRHAPEVNTLINELNSYKKDLKKEY